MIKTLVYSDQCSCFKEYFSNLFVDMRWFSSGMNQLGGSTVFSNYRTSDGWVDRAFK